MMSEGEREKEREKCKTHKCTGSGGGKTAKIVPGMMKKKKTEKTGHSKKWRKRKKRRGKLLVEH